MLKEAGSCRKEILTEGEMITGIVTPLDVTHTGRKNYNRTIVDVTFTQFLFYFSVKLMLMVW